MSKKDRHRIRSKKSSDKRSGLAHFYLWSFSKDRPYEVTKFKLFKMEPYDRTSCSNISGRAPLLHTLLKLTIVLNNIF